MWPWGSSLVLAGCGGAKKFPPPSPLAAAFKTEGGPALYRGQHGPEGRGGVSLPDVGSDPPRRTTDFPGIAAYEAKTVATEKSWQSAMIALGKPSSGGSRWKKFLTMVNRTVKEMTAQQAVAQTGAAAAFTSSYKALSSEQKADAKAAKRIGLPSCDPGKIGS